MQNEKRLSKIKRLLESVVDLDGEVVEIGCYLGGTSQFMARIIQPLRVHVFDAFQGLPKPTEEDVTVSPIHEGVIQVSLDQFVENWDNSLPWPHVNVGWIADTADSLPAKIKFVLIDLDLYLGTKQALNAVYARLIPSGIVVIDDYNHHVFGPSVQRATREFLADKPEILVSENLDCSFTGKDCDNAWFQRL